MKWSKIFAVTAGLLAIFVLAGFGGWLYQSGTITQWVSQWTTPTEAEKVESQVRQATGAVLDRIVGNGKYFVTVKATMSDRSEESEKVTLTPVSVTLNEVVNTKVQSEKESIDYKTLDELKAKQEAKKPKPKVQDSLPGFPVVIPEDTPREEQIVTPTIRNPALFGQTTQKHDVVYNAQRTKNVIPITLKKITVHVVIDERKMKLLKLDRTQLSAVLAEVSGINEERGDELILSSYKFSDAIFGLDQIYWESKDKLKKLNIPPEYLVGGILGVWLLIALVMLVWVYRRKKIARQALELQTLLDVERKNEREELDRERQFQALCRALIDFVERNPGFTASVISEMMSIAPAEETNASLPPLKKVLIFILFLEAERPELVQQILTEMGESLSKSLFQGANKFMKVDSGVLRAVLEEFYRLLVKKQYLIGGPTISQKILKTTFGVDEESSFDVTAEFSFQFLEKLSDERLLSFLSQDRPQLAALIFSFLDENRVVSILSHMDVDRAVNVSRLMLTLDVPNYFWVQKLSSALEMKLLAPEVSIDETEKLLKISRVLEKLSTELREKLMAFLSNVDPGLVQKMRTLIFTFEDFFTLSDDHLKAVLYEADIRHIGTAMLNCQGPLRDKILSNLSERMQQVVIETEKLSVSIRPSEIERAQYELVRIARQLADDEKIVFQKEGPA